MFVFHIMWNITTTYVPISSLHFVMIIHDIIYSFNKTISKYMTIPSKIKEAFLLAQSKESYILRFSQETGTATYIFIVFLKWTIMHLNYVRI